MDRQELIRSIYEDDEYDDLNLEIKNSNVEISSYEEEEEFRNDEENASYIHRDKEFRNSKTFEAPRLGWNSMMLKIYSFPTESRRRLKDEGDATTLLKVFLKMKEFDRDFFYKVKNDDKGLGIIYKVSDRVFMKDDEYKVVGVWIAYNP
ncbi:unnamed protein product [Dovyalis caffra]|uniref:Uncharacterized protein n=1 Tax=Dovyalis caffra TaxID=77055 RepID=A0AAV1R418_9ROSI|nr:unnamed protein product [Dovyalis caffra]